MRPQRPIDERARKSLDRLLRGTKSKADFQRVQSVWLRANLGWSHVEVARAVGLSPSRVKRIWSEYFARGEPALTGPGRGGRRRENMTRPEEERLLAEFSAAAEEGGVLVVNDVKAAYERRVDRTVPKSTVYRMLARHGWRKIAPRPLHPKNDPDQAGAFKKNSAPSSPKKPRAKGR
jgi:transposase